MNRVYENTLRTMMSLWLEQTDALARRLLESESVEGGDNNVAGLLADLRVAQTGVAQMFANKAQYMPEKYGKLLREAVELRNANRGS